MAQKCLGDRGSNPRDAATLLHMKDKDITLTPASAIVQMTKALPEIPNGARPVVYEQIIPEPVSANQSGSPDPAHYG
jgi:hypothetical protein